MNKQTSNEEIEIVQYAFEALVEKLSADVKSGKITQSKRVKIQRKYFNELKQVYAKHNVTMGLWAGMMEFSLNG